ncbi:Cys-tRNA(Pro) deacylase [Magnetospirillum sp. SS-4]|uniref:Cys-tRNA(Pro) deacylase n=1 Tax=Magnetospirillum sp. SS-4 TaxID=2681465 RepID=UPI00137D3E2D|nr:Cys-tRNA(Pro) deacylase [Magnetospirillum sp. SS-4]CAA7612664.1 Cys-tRNA(Pro)/Cys-tRNA(Cys) deacylase [Magnetospirillum sp. SS-4]
MSRTTRATQALDRAGVAYEVHTYAYDPSAGRVGLHAAESLGVSPGIVLKTLMILLDGKPVCAVIPSDREVSMKRLAAALKGKSAEMMKPADAERLTGYRIGGISPFGQKRSVPTVMERDALTLERVFLNGGQRGVQVAGAPEAFLAALRAVAASIA